MSVRIKIMYTPKHAAPSHRSPIREILEWIITLALAVGLALCVHTWVGENVIVIGPSMQPTLVENEKVLLVKAEYYFKTPKRGDIVVVKYPDRTEDIIKRVIATAGETIRVSDGSVYVNGKKLDEPYILEPMNYSMDELTVPADTIFVMGDNRNDSNDSHFTNVGPIPLTKVLGRAYAVVWPLKDAKLLTGYQGKFEK
jgi:signal peptidase I